MTQPLTPWQPAGFNLTALAQPRQTPAARRPPPATTTTGPAKPSGVPPARAPRPTLPLATPIEAPALNHLFGATTTRRAAWNTLVGNKRTNALVDYATNYRKANPTMFQGVFDGGTIDTPVNMRRLDQNGFAAMIRKQEPSSTPAASQAKAATTGGIMYTARNPHDTSFGAVRTGMGMDMSTLLHELSHTGTPTSKLTASGKPSGRPGVLATPTPEYLDTLFKQHPTNPTGRAAQRLTDATYSADLTTRPNEIGSQIISMKAHLEQQGVDTTSPDAIYRALKNPDHFKDAAFEPTKISRHLQLLADPRYGIPTEDYDKGLKAIADLMPGIAKVDTAQYPYRKVASEPTTLSQTSGDGVAGVNKNPLPKPSGASNHTFQMPARPRDYAVPLPTQPPPQNYASQLRKPSMQSSTIPLSAPISDPRMDHLIGDSVTRRQAIVTALGEQKATNFIDKSTAYRQANPKIFKGVYDGGNIDRPIKVLKDDAPLAPPGRYSPTRYVPETNEVLPGKILVRGDNPFTTLMHELFHLDTSGSSPQDVEGIIKDAQKREVSPIVQMRYNRNLPPDSRTGKDAKVITDLAYHPERKGSYRSEMGSQLGALRVHLEQLGIDTSNKEELRRALSTMGDDPRIMHNFEAQRIHRALNDTTLSPEERERGLDALVELMPGIAKTTTPTQYKTASAAPTTLEGIHMLALLRTW